MKICYLVERIGPYHHARLDRASQKGEIVVLELQPDSTTYQWDRIKTTGPGSLSYRRVSAVGVRNLRARLDEAEPDAVFLNGWSDLSAWTALNWCLRKNVPAIVLSDSQQRDEVRVPWKEQLKTWFLRGCSAAFVAGSRHEEYLRALGFGNRPMITGYDVVDNHYFQRGAQEVRCVGSQAREHLKLPASKYFLCVSRFVQKKNLLGLLNAFIIYRDSVGAASWHLVLLGDGELRADIEQRLVSASLTDLVHLVGFRQYAELPAFYGSAGAFVLASTSEQWGLVVNEAMAAGLPVLVSTACGCVSELVETNVNGYTFEPLDETELATKMRVVSNADHARLEEMSLAGQRIIARWSLDRFCDGLWKATEAACLEARTFPLSTGLKVLLRGFTAFWLLVNAVGSGRS